MSTLQRHIEVVERTLAPEYGPETSAEAIDRLFKYYQRLGEDDRTAFVAALIGELVTVKVFHRVKSGEGA